MKKSILLLLILIFSCAPKRGTIWLTQAQIDNPDIDTLAMPYLNVRCIYNDSTSEKPVPVKGYYRKDSTYVKPYKRSVPKY